MLFFRLIGNLKFMLTGLPLFLVSYGSLSQARFTDVTSSSGIDHQFVVYEGMFGGGAVVFDYNNDGFEDVFLTGGMRDDALYTNNGDGSFTNDYEKSGLTSSKHYVTQGAVSADFNKDGWRDLFITTITSRDSVKIIPRAENLFFLNNGNGTFTEATKAYGIHELLSFSTGANAGDFDGDGFTDLYVGNYFREYQGTLSQINDATIVGAGQTAHGYLLQNQGGNRFENVYEDYGLTHKGFGFGAVFTDFDNDSDNDLFINHDFGYKATPDIFLVNEYPEENFRDASKALNMNLKINAMGTAVGDFNNDSWLDYYVTNIRFNAFMVNPGNEKPFLNKAKELGVDFVSISWGANFADFDHDMDLDLFVANGDLNPNDVPLADFYFENDNGRFTDKASVVGLNDYGIGRGSVVFDMDNDGDLDVLVVNQKPVLDYPVSSVTRLYRNDAAPGHWLKVQLKGKHSDTNGIGSRVCVVSGQTRQIREIDGGSGHLSQNSTLAHFGLSGHSKADSVIVTWVGGRKQIFTNVPSNQILVVEELPVSTRSSTFFIAGVLFLVLLPLVPISIWLLRKRSLRKKEIMA